MEFQITAEAEQVRDAISGYLARYNDLATRTATSRSEPGWRDSFWHGMASELGLQGLLVPEDFGGVGAAPSVMMVVLQEIGAALVLEPFAVTAAVAAPVLAKCPMGEGTLHTIAEGKTRVAIHLDDEGPVNNRLIARKTDRGWSLDGSLEVVTGAPMANLLLASARTDAGAVLLCVPLDCPGLRMTAYPTIDGGRAANLEFTNVLLDEQAILAQGGEADELIAYAAAWRAATLGAEAIGVMRRLFADTRDYTKNRVQFGQPISRFQVLQHRMVDMFINVEMADAAVTGAFAALDDEAATRQMLETSVAALKVVVLDSMRFVAENAIQLHGGMGMTDELAVSHYFRRAIAIGLELGADSNALAEIRRSSTLAA